ncbi:Uncharacterised protein r2_g2025 [Pycnogonum litorale]
MLCSYILPQPNTWHRSLLPDQVTRVRFPNEPEVFTLNVPKSTNNWVMRRFVLKNYTFIKVLLSICCRFHFKTIKFICSRSFVLGELINESSIIVCELSFTD